MASQLSRRIIAITPGEKGYIETLLEGGCSNRLLKPRWNFSLYSERELFISPISLLKGIKSCLSRF